MKRAIARLVLMHFIGASWAAAAAAAATFSIGDTVKTTANLNVRVAAGAGQPEIAASAYPGYAPAGTVGKVVAGPVPANGYTWYKVDHGPGRYTGWSIGDSLQKVLVAVAPSQPAPAAPAPAAPTATPRTAPQPAPVATPPAPAPTPATPAAPTPVSPGAASEPGPVIGTLTPTLQWAAVPGAASYGVSISKYPYGSANVVFDRDSVVGTSVQVSAGALAPGMKYRWNLRARNSAGQWSPVSTALYFQTAAPTPVSPSAATTTSTPATPAAAPVTASSPPAGQLAVEKLVRETVQLESQGKFQAAIEKMEEIRKYDKKYWPSDLDSRIRQLQSKLQAMAFFDMKPATAPTAVSPGATTEPGPVIGTLTPTLQWTALLGAVSYGVGISKYPYGPSNLVWNPQVVTGTSVQMPGGVLQPGNKYRWNLQARNSAGQLSPLSPTLYFQTTMPPTPAPAAPVPAAPVTASIPATTPAEQLAVEKLVREAVQLESQGKFQAAIDKLEEVRKYDKKFWPADLDSRIRQLQSKLQAMMFFGTKTAPALAAPQAAPSAAPTITPPTAAPSAPTVTSPQPTPVPTAPAASSTRPSPTGAPSAPAPQAPAAVTVTLFVHAGSATGPVLPGAQVSGKDGAGKVFNLPADTSGCAKITGAPGTWQLALSMNGYRDLAGTVGVTASGTAHLVLAPIPQPPQPAAPTLSQLSAQPQTPAPVAGTISQASPQEVLASNSEAYTHAPHPKNAFNWNPDLVGFCTWYAADRWLWDENPELPSRRDAVKWVEDARGKGLTVGTVPVKGSIVVFGPTKKNSAGHVAYVESVGQTTYTISQMNAGKTFVSGLKTELFNRVTQDTLQIGRAEYKNMTMLGFIYPVAYSKQSSMAPPAPGAPVAVPVPASTPAPAAILDTIKRRLQALPAYPPYLHGTNAGWRGAIADAAVQAANRGRLAEYDRWYQAALNYRGLAEVQLTRAERLARVGKLEDAQRFIQDSDRCVKLYYLANDAAISLYSAGVEKAAYYAKAVYETSRAAFVLGSSAAGLGPVASVLADRLYTATDFAVNTSEMGLSKAAKQAVIDIIAQEVGKEMVKELAGTGLNSAQGAKPTLALKDLVTRLARDRSFCGRVAKAVTQGTSQEISSDLVSKLMSDVAAQTPSNP